MSKLETAKYFDNPDMPDVVFCESRQRNSDGVTRGMYFDILDGGWQVDGPGQWTRYVKASASALVAENARLRKALRSAYGYVKAHEFEGLTRNTLAAIEELLPDLKK